ncbi:dephospho-CoA kinase [Clostridium uliginosum]|uniref:Dephospho-CoA kinase n=1 Tax=Clostridium uliginosum TaxID=119641 RepID=A0A1I1RVW9_9CLOT|nr:dephospho-CoA kinase [Clostridium uliginosum]SFD38192.1 dephospho-CoA kinase [Clostridium uliginosum]
MIKIGLTGGIGTGKSTISNIFKSENLNVIDADEIAKEVLEKNPQILESVRTEFGAGFFDWRGEFRRREFGNHIFKFIKQRIKYEAIIMPYIKDAINNKIEFYEKKGEKLVIVDAPTLIENKMHEDVDYVILVCAENNTQIQRVKQRDKLSQAETISRINAQMTVSEKKNFANIIIDNNGDLIETQKQVYDLIDFMKAL